MERHAVFIHPKRTVFDHFILIVYKFPCGVIADAQPEVLPLILPKAHILAQVTAAESNGGKILPEDIALHRVPDPDQLGGVTVFVDEAHQNITFPVTVHIVKGDGVE